MREILFRGKRVPTGEWAYGFYAACKPRLSDSNQWVIQPVDEYGAPTILVNVNPNTVGQYTGLLDKNGKKIFEGDIVMDEWGKVKPVLFCTEDVASCGCCYPEFEGSGFKAKGISLVDSYVIGNIHDNPELLKGE